MAARKPQKTNSTQKVPIQLNLTLDVAQRFKHAAIGLNQSLSEVATYLILKEFGGVHLRGLNSPNQAGQGIGAPGQGTPTSTVNIPGVTDRMRAISDIHASSSRPVDDALENLKPD
jgi:hypothetical protein